MSVRDVDAGKRREEAECGCAFLFEPPTAKDEQWTKRQVVACGPHRKNREQPSSVVKPPEVTQ